MPEAQTSSLVLFNLLSVPIAAILFFFNREASFLPRHTERLCIHIHIVSIILSLVLLISSTICKASSLLPSLACKYPAVPRFKW